ncbi:MAG: hypothetical protein LBT76_07215 [Tannerella sp.]|jgi:hypothetical protein|nr:hypothetical protein [Tannerella sp.]
MIDFKKSLAKVMNKWKSPKTCGYKYRDVASRTGYKRADRTVCYRTAIPDGMNGYAMTGGFVIGVAFCTTAAANNAAAPARHEAGRGMNNE